MTFALKRQYINPIFFQKHPVQIQAMKPIQVLRLGDETADQQIGKAMGSKSFECESIGDIKDHLDEQSYLSDSDASEMTIIPLPGKKPRNVVVFVEGASCIGKTTSCDISFDYTKYVEQNALYADKNSDAAIQNLYNMKLYSDIVKMLVERNNCTVDQPDLYVDRFIFSSLVYDILFKCDGHIVEHEEFKRRVNAQYLNNVAFKKQLRDVWIDFIATLEVIAPNVRIELLLITPKSAIQAAAALERRGSMEVTRGFSLLNYMLNQMYLFNELYFISKLRNRIGVVAKTPVTREFIEQFFENK